MDEKAHCCLKECPNLPGQMTGIATKLIAWKERKKRKEGGRKEEEAFRRIKKDINITTKDSMWTLLNPDLSKPDSEKLKKKKFLFENMWQNLNIK